MTVFVDAPVPAATLDALVAHWPRLTSDGDVAELHDFARGIGVGRAYFIAGPHPAYELTPEARSRAAAAGARPALSVVRAQGRDAAGRRGRQWRAAS